MMEGDTEDRKMRAFVALPVSPEVRAHAMAVQERLQGLAPVKWVEPHNIHLTLRFLGDASSGQRSALERRLSASVAQCGAFALSLKGVGVFPQAGQPRALWLRVAAGQEAVEELAQVVETAAVAAGFSAEKRPFRAHLTLGRVKAQRAPIELVRALEAESQNPASSSMQVEQVLLMRSDLGRTGPVYAPLAAFRLQCAG